MTPDRFRECLTALNWSQRGLALLLDVDDREVRRWAAGKYEIPSRIAAWLEKLGAFHIENPPPAKDV